MRREGSFVNVNPEIMRHLAQRVQDRTFSPQRTSSTSAAMAPSSDVWGYQTTDEQGETKTGTYVAIGAGALAVGALAYFMIKKKKRGRR